MTITDTKAPLWVRRWRDGTFDGQTRSRVLAELVEFRDWKGSMNPLDAVVITPRHIDAVVLAGKWNRFTVNQIAAITGLSASRIRTILFDRGINTEGTNGTIDPRGLSFLLAAVRGLCQYKATGYFDHRLMATVSMYGSPGVVSSITGIPKHILTIYRKQIRDGVIEPLV